MQIPLMRDDPIVAPDAEPQRDDPTIIVDNQPYNYQYLESESRGSGMTQV